MSFRSGERRDGSSYKYPISGPNAEYEGIPLEVQKIEASISEEVRPKGFLIYMIFKNENDEIEEETIPVVAMDYNDALEEAMNEKEHEQSPVLVNMIDPSVQEIVSMAMEKAKRGSYKVKDVAISAGERAESIGKRALETMRGRYRDPSGKYSPEPYGVWKGLDAAAKTARGMGRAASLAGHIGYDVAKYWAMAPEERKLQMLEQYRKEGKITPGQFREYAGPLVDRLVHRKSRIERVFEAAGRRLEEAQIRYWLEDAYSSDPETRRYARMRLRETAPEVYGIMDFGSVRSPIVGRTSYVPISPEFRPKGGRAWQMVYDPASGRYLRVQEERTILSPHSPIPDVGRRYIEEEYGHSPIA